ncbi:cell division protein ZapA [Gracilinema caldarium]|uniref:cell division protein ZapA n=1 Tax=Gracilinema caldarium TaxID=215591 RepID=UPI0026EEAB3B|nr:cell division protein ZapA [Gracilinema caldarium]
MPKEGLRIDILGTSFTIRADEDPLYLNALLAKYQTTVDSVQKNTGLTDPLKTAIVAGIMLCDELEKQQRKINSSSLQVKQDSKELEQLLLDIITRIDSSLKQNDES